MSDLEIYRKATLGNSSGWGRKPALLIVDFTNGFNDPEKFGGGNIGAAVEKTIDLLAAARPAYRVFPGRLRRRRGGRRYLLPQGAWFEDPDRGQSR